MIQYLPLPLIAKPIVGTSLTSWIKQTCTALELDIFTSPEPTVAKSIYRRGCVNLHMNEIPRFERGCPPITRMTCGIADG
jgi:hypothetical protein